MQAVKISDNPDIPLFTYGRHLQTRSFSEDEITELLSKLCCDTFDAASPLTPYSFNQELVKLASNVPGNIKIKLDMAKAIRPIKGYDQIINNFDEIETLWLMNMDSQMDIKRRNLKTLYLSSATEEWDVISPILRESMPKNLIISNEESTGNLTYIQRNYQGYYTISSWRRIKDSVETFTAFNVRKASESIVDI